MAIRYAPQVQEYTCVTVESNSTPSKVHTGRRQSVRASNWLDFAEGTWVLPIVTAAAGMTPKVAVPRSYLKLKRSADPNVIFPIYHLPLMEEVLFADE